MLEEKSVKANRHGICHHGGSFFAVAKLTVRCCVQHVKKVTISLFYKLIYQLRKNVRRGIQLIYHFGRRQAKKSAARLGSALKIVKNFWEIWALTQEGWLLCLPEIDTYCAFRLA